MRRQKKDIRTIFSCRKEDVREGEEEQRSRQVAGRRKDHGERKPNIPGKKVEKPKSMELVEEASASGRNVCHSKGSERREDLPQGKEVSLQTLSQGFLAGREQLSQGSSDWTKLHASRDLICCIHCWKFSSNISE
ncbi:uncharacterized protein LOC120891841 [Ictidomys tridecemlineatus]